MANVPALHTYEDFMAFAKAQWESMQAKQPPQPLGGAANSIKRLSITFRVLFADIPYQIPSVKQ
jgi:hypothetical protein